ncbi:MAG: copper chaperone PCu(A)C [Caldilineaceae bacterium]|nr:copper chaperone PCu(A)C [Caldilineaceae bacterium]
MTRAKIPFILYQWSISLIVLLVAGCTLPATPQSAPALTGDAIRVESPMARPAIQSGNGAAYFTIVNPTESADQLLSVQSTVARVTELHETTEENGVMRMIPHPEGFEISARAVVELKPGGKHVMLLELSVPLAVGDEIPLTLTFEQAGTMEITVPVMEMGSAPTDHNHGN